MKNELEKQRKTLKAEQMKVKSVEGKYKAQISKLEEEKASAGMRTTLFVVSVFERYR